MDDAWISQVTHAYFAQVKQQWNVTEKIQENLNALRAEYGYE